jgi:hypothetical protein
MVRVAVEQVLWVLLLQALRLLLVLVELEFHQAYLVLPYSEPVAVEVLGTFPRALVATAAAVLVVLVVLERV